MDKMKLYATGYLLLSSSCITKAWVAAGTNAASKVGAGFSFFTNPIGAIALCHSSLIFAQDPFLSIDPFWWSFS